MPVWNGEPTPGFFKEMEENAAKMEHGLPADSVITFDMDTGDLMASAQWVEPQDARITALEEEVAELRDILKRTEDFTNSMLNKTVESPIELEIIKTPINVPARRIGEDGILRVIKPKKVLAQEDYDRAMSLVGK